MWPDTEMCPLYTSRLKINTSYDILEDILWKSKVQLEDEMRWFYETLETDYIQSSLPQVLVIYLTYVIILVKITLLCLPLQASDT